MQTEELAPDGLGISGGEVQALARGPRGPLHEVVQRRDGDDPVRMRVEGEPDIAEIRPREDLGFGVTVQACRLGHDPNERFPTVGFAVYPPEALRGTESRQKDGKSSGKETRQAISAARAR